MKKNIEHFLIIGDALTQKHDHSDSNADTDMNEIDLYNNDEEYLASIVSISTISQPLAWFDYLIDDILYTINQLDSRFRFSSKPRDEVNNLSLEHYLETHVSDKLKIEASNSEPDFNNLQQIDDALKQKNFSDTKKAQTLVIEWIGLHDLKEYASAKSGDSNTDHLVSKYLEHLTRLIKLGYKNFCILGAVHTHLTSANQSKVSLYNINLQTELGELQTANPDCNITFIDVQNILENSKTAIGEDLRLSTEAKQAIATSIIEQAINPHYNFILPEIILLAQFKKAFHASWQAAKNGKLGFLVEDPGINYLTCSLPEVLQHGKAKPRSRTAEVLKSLGWIRISGILNKSVTCISEQPLIQSTWDNKPRVDTMTNEYR